MILVTCPAAYFVGNKASKLFFISRAAVKAFAGNNKTPFSQEFVLLLIGASSPAAAEYDQEIQAGGIERHGLHIVNSRG
jgi:hypothetical protein